MRVDTQRRPFSRGTSAVPASDVAGPGPEPRPGQAPPSGSPHECGYLSSPHPASAPVSMFSTFRPPGSGNRASRWRPVVDGALRLEAEGALRRIAESISGPLTAWVPAGALQQARAAADASLGSGAAGFAGLQAYLAVAFPHGDHADRSAGGLAA